MPKGLNDFEKEIEIKNHRSRSIANPDGTGFTDFIWKCPECRITMAFYSKQRLENMVSSLAKEAKNHWELCPKRIKKDFLGFLMEAKETFRSTNA